MNTIQRFLRDLVTNPKELIQILFAVLIFLALTLFAKFVDDFHGQSQLNIILTYIGFAILAVFNVYFVPLIILDNALSWKFMGLIILAGIIGLCVVGYGYFYLPISLVIIGGTFTLIHLFYRTNTN